MHTGVLPFLLVADFSNHCVRFVSAGGVISTAAGVCTVQGYLGDGLPATAPTALFRGPTSVAYDGGLFVTEQGNQVVRYVSPAGTLSTVAGVAGVSGTTGDGGVATSALFNNPSVGPDGLGSWIIADTWSNVVRRLTLQSASPSATQTITVGASPSSSPIPARPFIISRVAGTYLSAGFAGDGASCCSILT